MIKKFSISINKIKSNESYRMSPQYYNVELLFSKLKNNKIGLDRDNFIIESGSYIRKYVNETNGIPYIRVNNEKNYILDESNFAYIEDKDINKKMKVNTFDIVFGRTQANIEKLGVFSMVDEEMNNSAISQHVTKISIKNNIISPFYLIAYLNSKFGKLQMAYATHGDTRVELTHNQARKLQIIIFEKK